MSLKTAVSRTVDNLFAWLDGPVMAPAPVPVKAPTPVAKRKSVTVPAGATELQKRTAKLAAMSDKCRMAYFKLENKATVAAATPGRITPFKDESGRQWYKVVGSKGKLYNVKPNFCDCPAADSRRIHGFCYHMLAVRMYVRGTQQVADAIVREERAPMPSGNGNVMIEKFLKSCCDVRFYNSGSLWRGTWLDGYELSQGSGTFEQMGFTARELMDYAADQEGIMLAMPRKTRGQIRISVHGNKQEHRDRKTLRAAQVLEAEDKPELGTLNAEANAELVTDEFIAEDFENLGQQVAAAVREQAAPPAREQVEPPIDPEDDPGPLAEPKIIGAIVTMHGVFLAKSNGVSEYKALGEGKRPEDAYTYLRGLGLVQKSRAGTDTPSATVTLALSA